MAKKRRKKKVEEVEVTSDDKAWGFVATFLSIIGFVLVLVRKEKSEYVRFYSSQSLVVFITAVVAGLIGWAVVWIPVLGGIIRAGLGVLVIVLWVLSWVYALSGKMKQVPLFGQYGRDLEED